VVILILTRLSSLAVGRRRPGPRHVGVIVTLQAAILATPAIRLRYLTAMAVVSAGLTFDVIRGTFAVYPDFADVATLIIECMFPAVAALVAITCLNDPTSGHMLATKRATLARQAVPDHLGLRCVPEALRRLEVVIKAVATNVNATHRERGSSRHRPAVPEGHPGRLPCSTRTGEPILQMGNTCFSGSRADANG